MITVRITILTNHLSEQIIYRKKKKSSRNAGTNGEEKPLVDTIEYFHGKINYLYYKKNPTLAIFAFRDRPTHIDLMSNFQTSTRSLFFFFILRQYRETRPQMLFM